jgi:hypothetical protein
MLTRTNVTNVINEKSNIIPINHKLTTSNKETNEYNLNQNFFDPSKSSPPNEFMIKLRMRMSIYNSRVSDKKVVNLDKE